MKSHEKLSEVDSKEKEPLSAPEKTATFSLPRTKRGSRKVMRMAQQQYIKDLYENEEVSLREIARRTGLSFQIVQKYAYKENWNEEELPNLEAENYPALQAYIPVIDEWMEADRKIPRKQPHTATRTYARLRDENGYPRQLLQRETVCREEAGDEAGGREIPAFATSGQEWAGRLWREHLLRWQRPETKRLRADGVVFPVKQGLHTVFPISELGISSDRIAEDL